MRHDPSNLRTSRQRKTRPTATNNLTRAPCASSLIEAENRDVGLDLSRADVVVTRAESSRRVLGREEATNMLVVKASPSEKSESHRCTSDAKILSGRSTTSLLARSDQKPS